MARKRDTKPEERKFRESSSVSRRDFIKQGMAAGVGAAALGGCAATPSAEGTSADGIKWDYEADVVVIGSGASGLPCAIRARDAGLSVLVIDQNFDVGGKMVAKVAAEVELGTKIGVQGTPTVYLNGRQVQGGALPYEELAKEIDAELAKTKK